MTSSAHAFHAVAFVENLALKELAPSYPEAKRTPRELWYATPAGGTVFVYPFRTGDHRLSGPLHACHTP